MSAAAWAALISVSVVRGVECWAEGAGRVELLVARLACAHAPGGDYSPVTPMPSLGTLMRRPART